MVNKSIVCASMIALISSIFAKPQQSTTLLAAARRNLYSNLTCPINCTCSTHQPRPEPIGRANQFETILPKQVVDCEQIAIDSVKDIFTFVPDGVTSFGLRRSALSSLIDICCMEDLETLDLSYNRISDLIIYVEFEKLTFLNLQNNSLRILRKDEFISFPNVETLNLDSNEIQIVDQESFRLMRLKQLHLSHNKITYINERAFRYAASLEVLNLAGNRLSSIHARNFYFSRKLRSLDLSNNHLTNIDEYGFEPLYRLEELNLSFNNLTSVPSPALRTLIFLKSLIFDGNPIAVFENGSFSQLNSLEALRLDQMPELTMILEGTFEDSPRLHRLSISSCKRLQYISPKAFGRNVGALNELYLTNNAIAFLPSSVVLLPSLEKSDYSGNPFSCECMRKVIDQLNSDQKAKFNGPFDPICHTNDGRMNSLFGNWMKSIESICVPSIVPTPDSNVTTTIGASISLYCAVINDDPKDSNRYVPKWTLPSGRTIPAGQRIGRFEIDEERLSIAFLLQEDSGRYSCSLTKIGNNSKSISDKVRYVNLNVDTTASIIVPIDISAYYVTFTWSQSPSQGSQKNPPNLPQLPPSRHYRFFSPPGDSKLLYKSEHDREFVHIELPVLWDRYTVNRLKPETNYSFCLIYAREKVTFYKYCTNVHTEKAYLQFGLTMNYSLLVLLTISITLICVLCVVRCVHKRLHIWQEEKYRGRMQESMSAQGFLSSFESLNSGLAAAASTAVTYENLAAVDGGASHLDEAETELSEAGSSRSRIACRRNICKKKSKNHSTVIVETHAVA